MALFGGVLVLPLYMQIVHGASPMKSGFLMLPMVMGLMTASIISGQVISRTGRIRGFPIFGSALSAVALLLLSRITADTALPLVMALMLLLGYGLGNCMQPLLLILQSSVPPRDIGVATASATFFRQIGGTIGVALFLSILFGQVGGHIGTALQNESQTPAFQQAVQHPVTPLDHQFAASLQSHGHSQLLGQVTDDSSFIQKLSPALAHPFKVGFARVDGHRVPDRGADRAAGLRGPAADAQGRAAGDVGQRRRAFRGRADRSGDRPGLSRDRAARPGLCLDGPHEQLGLHRRTRRRPRPPEHSGSDLDPAIAEAVDGVTNRFGAEGLEQMIAYAESSLADARARSSSSPPPSRKPGEVPLPPCPRASSRGSSLGCRRCPSRSSTSGAS